MKRLLFALLAISFSCAAAADELQTIKANKTLVCGTLTDSVPLGYQDPATRQPVGFDVDVCKGVAAHLGVNLELKSLSVEARIPALNSGRVNIVAAALGYTKERATQVDFSSAYYSVPDIIMVKDASGIETFAQMAGKRVSAIQGSTPGMYARQQLAGATVMTYADAPSAFLALQQGKVDGLALSQPAALRFVARSGGKMHFLKQALHYEPTCIGVKKGEVSLLAAVNQALQAMENDGELDRIWNKWFGPNTEYKMTRDKKLTPLSEFQ